MQLYSFKKHELIYAPKKFYEIDAYLRKYMPKLHKKYEFNAPALKLFYRCNQWTAHFLKCKQLFEYQHLLLLRVQSSNPYLNAIHFLNTRVK